MTAYRPKSRRTTPEIPYAHPSNGDAPPLADEALELSHLGGWNVRKVPVQTVPVPVLTGWNVRKVPVTGEDRPA